MNPRRDEITTKAWDWTSNPPRGTCTQHPPVARSSPGTASQLRVMVTSERVALEEDTLQPSLLSRHDREAVCMAGPDGVEVSPVECGDLGDAEPLGDGDHGGVGGAQGVSRRRSPPDRPCAHSRSARGRRWTRPSGRSSAGTRPRCLVRLHGPAGSRPRRRRVAGTRMVRRARCRPVSRSVHARLSRSSRSAATSGPVSQTITQERPKPSASRSS